MLELQAPEGMTCDIIHYVRSASTKCMNSLILFFVLTISVVKNCAQNLELFLRADVLILLGACCVGGAVCTWTPSASDSLTHGLSNLLLSGGHFVSALDTVCLGLLNSRYI